jgi:hypothetical protein
VGEIAGEGRSESLKRIAIGPEKEKKEKKERGLPQRSGYGRAVIWLDPEARARVLRTH